MQPVAPTSPEAGPIISVKRLISCPTYCSRLHVNQHMAEHLLPALPESASIKVGIAAPSLSNSINISSDKNDKLLHEMHTVVVTIATRTRVT